MDPSTRERVLEVVGPQLSALQAAGVSATVVAGGQVLAATDDVPALLGRADQTFKPMSLGASMAAEQAERLRGAVARVAASLEPEEVLYEYRHAAGYTRKVSTRVLPVPGLDAETGAVLIVASPDHDHRTNLRMVNRQLTDLYQLLDVIDAAVYRLDRIPDLHFAYLNQRATQVLELTFAELAEDPELVVRRVHPDDRAELLAGRADPRSVTWPQHLRWERLSGEYAVLEVNEIAVYGREGDVVASMGTVRDLSAMETEADALRAALQREQEAVDQLREVDELRQTFLRAVSHELRTPLTAVTGYAETLLTHMERLSTQQLSSLAERMYRNAERLRELLDDLLDIDRMSRGTLTADLRSVDLVDAVLPAIDAVEARVGQVRADLQPTRALVDVPKLQRVVDNLVGNAIKHGGPEVTVWVRTRVGADGRAELVVEDDGPGIPVEDRDRLFEPFEQGTASARAHSPGTGLGLTLVRELVTLQGGEVVVEDRDSGGVRFVIRFPTGEDAT